MNKKTMKAVLFAALAACWVVTTGVAGAQDSNGQSGGSPATGAPAASTPPADMPVTGAAPAAILAGPKAITVDAATQARLGVTLATVKGAATPTETESTARVLEPSRLVQLDSELSAAAATFSAARTEVLRLRKLYSEERTASARAGAEAAGSKAESDLELVNTAHRQLALEWGSGVANLQARQRADLLNELADAHAQLVRVEVPEGAPIPRAGYSIQVRGSSAAEVFSGTVLGSLPVADPSAPTRGVLVELKGETARLPIGQMLSARLPGADLAGSDGVILPHAALLRRDAQEWVYVQTAPTVFVRREVRDFRQVISGWFVPMGFVPGDRVVASGAAGLLGVESPAGAADAH